MTKRKSFLLRIPPELYRDLEIWARDELRSVNAQIEFILRRATNQRAGRKADDPRPDAGSPESHGDSRGSDDGGNA